MIQKMNPAEAPRVKAAVDGRIMFTEERLEAILLTLAPGESMPVHQNPFDVLFACIDGNARLVTAEQEMNITPGECIFVTADEARGWENKSANPCRILVIKILYRKTGKV